MGRLSKAWTAEVHDRALAAELHQVLAVSHRQAKGLIDARCVKVNNEEAKSYGVRLKVGDAIAVDYDEARTYQALPSPRKCLEETGFKILHEDQHVVFVDKPAGLLTVPAEKGNEANLAEALTDHYRRRGFKRFHLFIVHRLDRYTSGVLVFAKTPEALHGLKKMFEEHHLQRVYKAILVGELPENAGTLTAKLVEHSKSLRISVVEGKKEQKGAKHAITHYRVLERLPGYTVVEVKLETGRRNQIRVQFADRGFPLLGDHVYGEKSELIDRQALHAELLGFRHPVTEDQITIQSALPKDMEAALKALRTVRRVERAAAGLQGEEGIYKPKITNSRKLDRMERAKRFGDAEPVPEARPTRPRFKREGDSPEGRRPSHRPSHGDKGGPTGDRPRMGKGEGRFAKDRSPRGEGRGEARGPRRERTGQDGRPERARSSLDGKPMGKPRTDRPGGSRAPVKASSPKPRPAFKKSDKKHE